eukprot:jgi/Orpsp1_1/1188755/evm.model.d7180000066971.1
MSVSTINIECCDGTIIEFDEEIAEKLETINNGKIVVNDNNDKNKLISLKEMEGIEYITGPVLKKIKEYCEYHRNDKAKGKYDFEDDEPSEWDKKFLKNMKNNDELFCVTLAADYFNIQELFNIGCRHIADDIRGAKIEAIKEYFQISEPTIDNENDTEIYDEKSR